MGDALMLSGVLKLVVDRFPERRFNLVRRTAYQDILAGHPAIRTVGYPPKDARIITTDYWTKERLGEGDRRPFQILARMFGLSTPVEERLYVGGARRVDGVLFKFIPWDERTVVILSPASDSPRKTPSFSKWVSLVEQLGDAGYFVIQVGREREPRLPGTYSLLGLTDARDLAGLIGRSDAVVCVDNFVMHTAHLAGTPAVVLWGPTDPAMYGYDEQTHIRGDFNECPLRHECLGPRFPQNYSTDCPRGAERCLDAIAVHDIVSSVRELCAATNPHRQPKPGIAT